MTNCERACLALSLGDECSADESVFLKGHINLCEACARAASEIRSLASAAQEAVFTPGEALTRNLRERILSKLPAKATGPWWVFRPGWAMAFALILAFGVFWRRGAKLSERETAFRAVQNLEIVENVDLFTEMEILENLEALEKI